MPAGYSECLCVQQEGRAGFPEEGTFRLRPEGWEELARQGEMGLGFQSRHKSIEKTRGGVWSVCPKCF